MTNPWQAQAYDEEFAFVSALGRELIGELAVRPGERILDLGCGTGHLTAALARSGAVVVGVDADAAMLARAGEQYPDLTWVSADAQDLASVDLGGAPFDAVLSNAALHWMPRQADVLRGLRAHVRDGARFVAEMGGAGNIAGVDAVLRTALRESGIDVDVPANFFPTVATEATLLEGAGFRVDWMRWFERPTPLAAGQTPVDWVGHFRAGVWAQVPDAAREEVGRRLLAAANERGLGTDVGWAIDYCRLRFHATAVS